MTFGRWQSDFWRLLRMHGVPQRNVSIDLGVSESLVSMWASGDRSMSFGAAMAVVRCESCDPCRLALLALLTRECGVVVVDRAVGEAGGDLLRETASIGAQVGNLQRVVLDATEDGCIDDDERAQSLREVETLERRLARLRLSLTRVREVA